MGLSRLSYSIRILNNVDYKGHVNYLDRDALFLIFD